MRFRDMTELGDIMPRVSGDTHLDWTERVIATLGDALYHNGETDGFSLLKAILKRTYAERLDRDGFCPHCMRKKDE